MKPIIIFITLCLIISCKQKDSVQEKTNQTSKGETIVQQKGCSKEAMLCPNGRSVMRNPNNNCEFDPCPDKAQKTQEKLCTADVKQCHDGSFVGRDGYNNCQFKDCPPSNNGRGDGLD